MDAPITHDDGRRDRLGTIVIAGVVGLALVAVMVTRTSAAVFTASVDNTGNYFHGGTVTLGDNDANAAMFEIAAMDPGETYTSCINVEYSGTITSPSAVKVYSGQAPLQLNPTTSVLGDYLNITIERGTSDSITFGDCGTFVLEETALAATPLSTFYANHTNYTTGVGTWTPAGTPETRTYRITAELLETVPDTEEGATIDGVTFVWEIQS